MWLSDDDWPLEFKVYVSTDDLAALRFMNNISRGNKNVHIKPYLKQLRNLEKKIHAKLCLGPDA